MPFYSYTGCALQDLVEKLSNLLAAKNMLLVTAESCTGGLLAAAVTHRPGASKIFERGFITYSNESKTEVLGVPEKTLAEHGAVSAETAQAMARGALTASKAHVAVSITGIAGPQGNTDDKPVGLVHFGYALVDGSAGTIQKNFTGDRNEIQTQSVRTAIEHLILVLEENT